MLVELRRAGQVVQEEIDHQIDTTPAMERRLREALRSRWFEEVIDRLSRPSYPRSASPLFERLPE